MHRFSSLARSLAKQDINRRSLHRSEQGLLKVRPPPLLFWATLSDIWTLHGGLRPRRLKWPLQQTQGGTIAQALPFQSATNPKTTSMKIMRHHTPVAISRTRTFPVLEHRLPQDKHTSKQSLAFNLACSIQSSPRTSGNLSHIRSRVRTS